MTSEEIKKTRLLVDLDSIFDTRLGTLLQMGDDKAQAAIDHGYHDRISDSWPGVDFQEFKERYKKRDKVTLKHSLVTPMLSLAKEFALQILNNINNTPFHSVPILLLNIYPYALSDEEVKVIAAGVKAGTMGLCEIQIVNMSPEEITPLYVKLNLALLAIYDYDEWLDLHAVNGNWKSCRAPDVTLLAPMIAKTDVKHASNSVQEGFAEMQKMTAPFIDLKLLHIENFSLVLRASDFKEKT